MLVQVVPIKRLPRSKTSFDYLANRKISGDIKIGQLVKIPFRNKIEFGIVCGYNRKSAPFRSTGRLKTIEEIVFKEPLLSEKQINFLKEISDFYHTSLSFVFKTNLLPLQKRKLTKIKDLIEKKQPNGGTQKFQRPKFFIYSDKKDRIDYFKKNWPTNGQILILTPEISQLKELIQELPPQIRKKILIITGELSEKEMFEAWLKIKNNPRIAVAGTRRALFLPWNNLKTVFMDDEGNPDYKSWDMAPRIHTRDAALMLAKQHAAELRFLTHTPSVETYYFASNKIYSASNPEIQAFRDKPFILTDLKQERRGGNYGLLNDNLISDIGALAGGDAFLFINRRGDAGFVLCRDCGFILKCPYCRRPLTYYKQQNHVKCHYCRSTEKMPADCEKCGNVNLFFTGAGTTAIEAELKKIPALKQFKIIRLDSESKAPEKESTDRDKRPKIIVGTEYAWGRINWPKIKLMVFLDADMPLIIPEYKSSENLWQLLRAAQYNLAIGAKLHIQTSYPEHSVFQGLYQPENFYQEQLNERKIFQYPPYNFLLKLFNGENSPAAAAVAGQKMRDQLKRLTENKNDIIISHSLEAAPSFYRQRHWQIILIKIGYTHYKKNVKFILKEVPDNWKVDPNPNSLLSLT